MAYKLCPRAFSITNRGVTTMEFREKIKFVRNKLYLSQEMLAKELGVAFATVNRWETGRCKPNYQTQRKFAEYCKANGISFDD